MHNNVFVRPDLLAVFAAIAAVILLATLTSSCQTSAPQVNGGQTFSDILGGSEDDDEGKEVPV